MILASPGKKALDSHATSWRIIIPEGRNPMKTVKEVSRLTGVSVRTLHHYDAIGLLKPSCVTDAGYRLYDDAALRRLQAILLFRELQFPLKEIRAILDSPAFDPADALTQQIRLLEMQRDRLNGIIALARKIQQKGVDIMNFDAFDRTEIDQYAAEAKARWGDTAAYAEFAAHPAENHKAAGEALMAILAEIGGMKRLSPDDAAVQRKIGQLQQHITDNFYTCSDEILRGLGEMYVSDERFRKNIDCAGGEGTAEFIRRSILAHTGN